VTAHATSQAILDAARRVVANRGHRRLTLSEVAAEAGVSRPTLYRWFPSKAILLAAMAADAVDRFDRGLRAAVAAAPSPGARLDVAVRYIVRHLDDTWGPAAIRAESDFALQSLGDSLGPHVGLVADLLGDALDRVPAVASGGVTRRQLAELVLRVAYSHYLVPHGDPNELVATVSALAGLGAGRAT